MRKGAGGGGGGKGRKPGGQGQIQDNKELVFGNKAVASDSSLCTLAQLGICVVDAA